METNDKLGDRLSSRLPQPANIEEYRREVASLVQKAEGAQRRERQWGTAIGIFVALMAVAFMVLGAQRANSPEGAFFGTVANFVFLYVGIETLKQLVNRSRVELLRELKQIQLQVLELKPSIPGTRN